MTNVDALKNLYVAFGGQLTDTYEDINDRVTVGNYATSADVISAIAKKVPSGSGSSLPEVTSEDNGKVLTVVEGEWTAATPATNTKE